MIASSLGGRVAIVAMAILLDAAAIAAGDATRGARVFGQCTACHSLTAGEHMTGPSLAHVWNSKAASEQGFARYSDAMKRAEVVWNDATLDKWLANPENFLSGTSMAFAGLKVAKDRQDVIAYLKAVAEGKAPRAEPAGRGMMASPGAKLDLRKAPPEGRVTAIEYCGDTYTVSTADGKNEKVWEFNLRFKTYSSKLGPPPGEPVIVGAGMRGDRASIVFSSPGEIGRFIKPFCR